MHNLAEIQEQIRGVILGSDKSLPFIKKNGTITTAQRLQIHIDTVFENFIGRLKITYPGTWKLIGEGCARAASLVYSHDYNNLTDRSKINDFGDDFPAFLGKFSSTKHLAYLESYAQLELLLSKSYDAIHKEPLSAEEMQFYFSEDIESCKLLFNPSIFFLHSNFSLLDIKLLLDNPDSSKISLKNEDSYLMIYKLYNKIQPLALHKKQWLFLKTIADGQTIGEAMDIFTEKEIETELLSMINLMFDKKMIVKINSKNT
jgi:hypothetical protein